MIILVMDEHGRYGLTRTSTRENREQLRMVLLFGPNAAVQV